MFGGSKDIRKKTEKDENNGACFGGFGGRLAYERFCGRKSRGSIGDAMPKIAQIILACAFFGGLGTLCGFMMFNVIQGDYIPSRSLTADTAYAELGALAERAESMSSLTYAGGVEMVDVTEELSERYRIPMGVMIKRLAEDSTGYSDGVRSGDIVVMVGGKPVLQTKDFESIEAECGSGERVLVRIFRNGEFRNLTVTVK